MKVFVKKPVRRIRSGIILFEKFDVFINSLQKPLDSSSNKKKNSPAHVTIQKQGEQQTQQDKELTQGKASIICSKTPFSKIWFLRDDSLLYKASLKKLVHTKI